MTSEGEGADVAHAVHAYDAYNASGDPGGGPPLAAVSDSAGTMGPPLSSSTRADALSRGDKVVPAPDPMCIHL